jgi:hypothetical protein
MIRKTLLLLLVFVCISFPQVNTWTKVADSVIGERQFGCLVYLPHEQGFLLSMGVLDERIDHAYPNVLYYQPQNRWINFLPHASLYGQWADSTGLAYNNGLSTNSTFGSYYFIFKEIDGYLRPSIHHSNSRMYYQYAYNTDDKKIYYYAGNRTFTYDTQNRLWDTLSPSIHPAAGEGGTARLWWGSMCYDPVNKEIVLFGGGGVDMENGTPGTWTLDPSSGEWSRLNLSVEPGPRALSPMVYDPQNEVIILFGGDHLDYLYSDTWVYTCASRTWQRRYPAISPFPRAGHALLYLPKSRKVVLAGGFEYSELSTYASGQYKNRDPFELWTYDVGQNEWTLIKAFSSGETKPGFRNGRAGLPAMAAADTADRILVLGDYRNPATYMLECDPTQTDPSGTQANGVSQETHDWRTGPYNPWWYFDVSPANPDSFENFLKTMPTNQWIKVTPPKNPHAGYTMVDRCWGTRILDPDRGYILIWAGGHSSHCGTDVARYDIHTNRWYIDQFGDWPLESSYSNTGYPPLFTFNNRPFMTGHTYDNYDYDVNLKKIVLVKSKYTYTYNTDSLDWDSLRILNHPEMRGQFYRTSVTSTPYGVFCWTQHVSSTIVFALFLLDSATTTWKKLTVNGETIPVYYSDFGGAVYDSKRDRMVMISKDSQTGQVWAYDFSTSSLSKLNPSGSYGSNGYWRESVYLPVQDKVLVQGDRIYDCAGNSWSTTSYTKGSGVGSTSTVNSGYMYDPWRDLVWDCENPDLYVLRVSGGHDPNSLPDPPYVNQPPLKKESSVKAIKDLFIASPNPLNASTTFGFNVKSSAAVSLKIYTVSGRLVQTIVDGQKIKKGAHYIKWNGKDSRNRSIPCGIYICVLKTGNVKKTLKVTLLK